MSHGRILGGVVATPDLDAALRDYRDTLGLTVVAEGTLGGALAAAWDAPALAGARTATLVPASGADCHIRLVEQPLPAGYRPTTTFGWNAYEITVQNVFDWPGKLGGSGFTVVGPPKIIPGMTSFIALQMTGRGQEMIYLNEVRSDTPTADLPFAKSTIDHIFIVILGVPDRAAALAWYQDRLGLEEGGTYTLEYTMINRAFGLPAGTQSTITMAQKGRLPIVEIDGYPAAAMPRAVAAGQLPPGNAVVSLAVDDLSALDLDWLAAPARYDGPLYRGGLAGTVHGPGGELLELVERH